MHDQVFQREQQVRERAEPAAIALFDRVAPLMNPDARTLNGCVRGEITGKQHGVAGPEVLKVIADEGLSLILGHVRPPPLPPWPIRAVTSYGPRRVPAERDIGVHRFRVSTLQVKLG